MPSLIPASVRATLRASKSSNCRNPALFRSVRLNPAQHGCLVRRTFRASPRFAENTSAAETPLPSTIRHIKTIYRGRKEDARIQQSRAGRKTAYGKEPSKQDVRHPSAAKNQRDDRAAAGKGVDAVVLRRYARQEAKRIAKASPGELQDIAEGKRGQRIPLRSVITSPEELDQYFEEPCWSVEDLLIPRSTSEAADSLPEVSQKTLHHLLNLSALPLPQTAAHESAMLATLRSQLHFVREVQSVDTTGIEPLSAIREETEEAVTERTIGLDTLSEDLSKETIKGRMRRPRRVTREEDGPKVKEGGNIESDGGMTWQPLKTAPKTHGQYFVVEAQKAAPPT